MYTYEKAQEEKAAIDFDAKFIANEKSIFLSKSTPIDENGNIFVGYREQEHDAFGACVVYEF